MPPSSRSAWAAQAGLLAPGKNGIGVGPELKALGRPKKSQRSMPVAAAADSPVPLTSVLVSIGPHGCAEYKLTMELSSQPSKKLGEGFLPRNLVVDRERKTVAYVEITAGIFALRMHGILGQAQACSEVPVGTHIVECVSIGITCNKGRTMKIARRQSGL